VRERDISGNKSYVVFMLLFIVVVLPCMFISQINVYIYILCPEKSKPHTMYHRNVKSECILCKFCVLDSKVFCEICTKFHLKILFDSRVINL